MSDEIDEKVVSMRFNNNQFQQGVADTMKSLDGLKKGLNLDGATKGLTELSTAAGAFSLHGIGDGVEGLSGKFIALATIGITALVGIMNQAFATGAALVNSLTIGPISDGLADYNRKLTSVQTIMNATGEDIKVVSGYFDILDEYADKTIYNLSDMTSAFAKFTNAGVDMELSVPAIKGIANMVALAGQDANAAAIAMYNLSQSISGGFLTTMDYKSLNLANVATREWKEQMVLGAIAAGTLTQNADGLYQTLGSDKTYTMMSLFTEGLSDQWATTGVLLDVLGKYGDETTTIGAKAQAAAQDVKSFSMMMDTLKAAAGTGWTDTFEIVVGNLEEAKALFTPLTNEIGGFLDMMGDARNELLQGWKDLGGRTSAIDAFKNAWEALLTVIRPIIRAFEQIFPPVTADRLFAITEAVRKFTESLSLNYGVQADLQRTFRGLFAVFDILFTIIGKVVGMFFELFGGATKGASGILDITGNIGDFLVSLRDAIKNGEGLSKFFEGLTKVLQVPINLIRGFVGILVAMGSGLAALPTDGFEGFLDRLKERLQPLALFGEFIVGMFQRLGDILKKVAQFFAPLAAVIGSIAGAIGNAVKDAFSTGDFGSITDLINTGLLAGIIGIVVTFIAKLTGMFSSFGEGGFFRSIIDVFGSLTGTLEAMQGKLRAQTLLLIAGAVAILAASVVALSLIDPVKLASALGGLTVLMGQLIGFFAALDAISTFGGAAKLILIAGAFTILGIALLLFAGAVSMLARLDWVELAKGLTGVTVILGVLLGVTKLMASRGPGFVIAATGLIALAIAVKILASAVTDLAGNSWEELAKGLVGLTVMLGLIVGLTKLMGNPAGIVSTAIGLILIGAAVKILASALGDFAQYNWEELARGMSAMAVALGLLIGAMALLSQMKGLVAGGAALVIAATGVLILGNALQLFVGFSWDELARGGVALAGSLAILAGALLLMGTGNVLLGSIGLTIASAALLILGNALQTFTSFSWDEIARGGVALAGTLLILAGAMALMGLPPVLLGSVGLLAAGFALLMLAPALKILGSMSWDDIGRGLTILASSLVIAAAAGILLIPAIPGLLGLGAAIFLIGAGAALAGVGIAALAIGLTALSVAGAAGITVLIAAVSALAGLIPYIAQQVGLGIIAIAAVIANSGPTILEAITTVLLALIAAIVAVIPPAVDAIVLLVTKLVEALVVLIPLLVDAGLRIIIGILDGIANNIGMVIEKGTDVIVAFINGIAAAIPRVMQAAANLIISFVDGLANTIRNNSARMRDAGWNLAGAIIDGITGGLFSGVSSVINSIVNVASSALQAAKNALGIASPSKEFEKVGMYSDQGLAGGFKKYGHLVTAAGENVGEGAISAVRKSLSGLSNAVSANVDIQPKIRPVLDLSQIKKDGQLIAGLLPAPTLSLDNTRSNANAAYTGYEENVRVRTDADGQLSGETTVLDYTQIINSPKALSPAEVYRNTKSALAVAKGELDK